MAGNISNGESLISDNNKHNSTRWCRGFSHFRPNLIRLEWPEAVMIGLGTRGASCSRLGAGVIPDCAMTIQALTSPTS